MLAAMADVFFELTNKNVAVFLTDPKDDAPPAGFEKMGLGCICTTEACDNKWPKQYFGGFESVANPVDCWSMGKKNGHWFVLPR